MFWFSCPFESDCVDGDGPPLVCAPWPSILALVGAAAATLLPLLTALALAT